jgi:aminoglycoside phosphotransferase (APT) family kinase protein
MHGDLTPWNLRELPDGRLILFDWEDAAWGPPHADMVLYRCTDAAVRKRYRGVPDAGEAARYWLSVIAEREDGTVRDRRLDQSLRRALLTMQEDELPARPAAGAAGSSSAV